LARLFVDPRKLGDDILIVSDEDHRYLTRVLRLGIGEPLVLFDGHGQEAEARILRIGPRALELKIETRRRVEAARRPDVTLIQGLTKGEKLEMVVQKATELGVARIIPVTSQRSVPRIEAVRAIGRRTRWQKIAREAARQSGRADVPEVEPVTVLETALASAQRDALRLMLWEGDRRHSLRDALPAERPEQIVVAVGPEGGFAPAEVEAARQAGFGVAGLGERILRAETAALTVLAILGFVFGDLGGDEDGAPPRDEG
jgi:16S rRNA (uracil1498-N3)-methyltransferase